MKCDDASTIDYTMVTIEQGDDCYLVRGKTRILKEELESLEGRWDPMKCHWVLPKYYDPGVLDIYLTATSILKNKQAQIQYEYTLLFARNKGRPQWVCCDQADIRSVINEEVSCAVHTRCAVHTSP